MYLDPEQQAKLYELLHNHSWAVALLRQTEDDLDLVSDQRDELRRQVRDLKLCLRILYATVLGVIALYAWSVVR